MTCETEFSARLPGISSQTIRPGCRWAGVIGIVKLPFDNLAGPVECWKRASRHDKSNDMASIFSGAKPELGCPRSSPNPGNPHRLPGYFPHDEASHTVVETSVASLRRSLRLGLSEDGRLPSQREAKVQCLRALTFSLSFSLSGDNSGVSNLEASRAMPRFFLGASLCFCSLLSLIGR